MILKINGTQLEYFQYCNYDRLFWAWRLGRLFMMYIVLWPVLGTHREPFEFVDEPDP